MILTTSISQGKGPTSGKKCQLIIYGLEVLAGMLDDGVIFGVHFLEVVCSPHPPFSPFLFLFFFIPSSQSLTHVYPFCRNTLSINNKVMAINVMD